MARDNLYAAPLLAGKYQVISLLGRGAFGEVTKVKLVAEQEVAVCKSMCYTHLSKKEKLLIVSEVNLMRELVHPHIVRYHDRYIDRREGRIYVFMEYCQGGDLKKLISECADRSLSASKDRRQVQVRDRNMSDIEAEVYGEAVAHHSIREEFIWKVLVQLCLAFEYCHNRVGTQTGLLQPILHRDVKPGNIFLDLFGNVKVGDFGLAKELKEKKMAHTFVGTPYYIAPEIVLEQAYDEKCDVWSLGCVIYELASLKPPFLAKNIVSLGKSIIKGSFPRIPAHYSAALQEVIQLFLTNNTSHRLTIKDLLQHSAVAAQRRKQVERRELSLARKEKNLARRERLLLLKEKNLRSLCSVSTGSSTTFSG